MPRRSSWNHVATIGYMIMAVSLVIFFVNIVYAFVAGKKAAPNYWGEGATTLEWTLSSPPPFHQFETLPVIEDTPPLSRDRANQKARSSANGAPLSRREGWVRDSARVIRR
jgi:heme/copper-type cytochrome/quinol oxidase subunit 1